MRVVEYGTFERIGSSETRKVNVRIIGATNADLKKMCLEGKFKEDLLDRLSFDVIFVPPLRRRGNDILLLAENFAFRMAHECGRSFSPYFSDEVKKALLAYSWPGNIRELKNTIERAVYKSTKAEITEVVFNPFENPYSEKEKDDEKDIFNSYGLEEFEKAREDLDISFIHRSLQENDNNQKKAAESLGLSYDQFRGIYRKYYNRLNNRSEKG